jgi:hypothetical protein
MKTMKKLIFLMFAMAMMLNVNAQVQAPIKWDFTVGSWPTGFTTATLDAGVAAVDSWQPAGWFGDNAAWKILSNAASPVGTGGPALPSGSTNVAWSTAYFTVPSITANRWMILPQIIVVAGDSIRWQCRSIDASERGIYEVRISTTDNDPASFTQVLPITVATPGTSWLEQKIDLTPYAGTIYIAFVQIGTNSASRWMIGIGDLELTRMPPPPANDIKILPALTWGQIPKSQFPFSAKAENLGANAETNVYLTGTINGTAIGTTSTPAVPTLAAGATSTLMTIVPTMTAIPAGTANTLVLNAFSDELTTATANNTFTMTFASSDTMFAVDRITAVPPTGAGSHATNPSFAVGTTFGNIYEITKPTALTRIQLGYHSNLVAASYNFVLYEMDGDFSVGAEILRLNGLVSAGTNNTNRLLTANLPEPMYLPEGRYFLAMQFMTASSPNILIETGVNATADRISYNMIGTDLTPRAAAGALLIRMIVNDNITFPANDLAITGNSLHPYTQIPTNQPHTATYAVTVTNKGTATQTDLVLSANLNGTAVGTPTAPVASLIAGASTTINITVPITTILSGTNTMILTVNQDETDENPADNTVTLTFLGTDSIFAVDNVTTFTNGRGSSMSSDVPFTIGNVIEVTEQTTLVQVRVAFATSSSIENYTVQLYAMTDDVTTVSIPMIDQPAIRGTSGWNTVSVPRTILDPGKYFISVQQPGFWPVLDVSSDNIIARVSAYRKIDNDLTAQPTWGSLGIRMVVDTAELVVSDNELLLSVNYPYTQVPISQVLPSAKVIGVGSSTQTNVVMTAELGGVEVGTSVPTTVNFEETKVLTLDPAAQVILGLNDVLYYVTSDEGLDVPENGIAEFSFIGTPNLFAADGVTSLSLSSPAWTNNNVRTLGNIFEITAPTTLSQVMMASRVNQGQDFSITLYQMTGDLTVNATPLFTQNIPLAQHAFSNAGTWGLYDVPQTPLAVGRYYLSVTQSSENITLGVVHDGSTKGFYSLDGTTLVRQSAGAVAVRMVMTATSCPVPTNLAVNNITATHADFSWQGGDPLLYRLIEMRGAAGATSASTIVYTLPGSTKSWNNGVNQYVRNQTVSWKLVSLCDANNKDTIDGPTFTTWGDTTLLSLTAMPLPVNGTNLNAQQQVSCSIVRAVGSTANVSDVHLTLEVNGVVDTTEIRTNLMFNNTPALYTFTKRADLSAPGYHTLRIWVSGSTPQNNTADGSDTIVKVVKNTVHNAALDRFVGLPTNTTPTAAQAVQVVVQNFGSDTLTMLPIVLMNGTTEISRDTITNEIIPRIYDANFEYIHTFRNTIDLSTAGEYNLTAFVALPVDHNRLNDTIRQTITVVVPTYTVTITSPTNGTFTVMDGTTAVNTGVVLDQGTVLTLTATPNTGYDFGAWMDGNTNPTRTLTLTQDTIISATFVPKTFTVTFMPNGGTGTMASQTFTFGVIDELNPNTFVAPTGKFFNAWSYTADGAAAYANGGDFSATKDTTLYALWSDNPPVVYTITLSANPTIGGTVTGYGPYNEDMEVVATAIPNAGYQFVNWTEGGTQVSTNAVYTFPALADRTLVANFEVITYTVTITPPTNGTFTVMNGTTAVNTGAVLATGTVLTLTATPAAGYNFVQWMDGNINLTRTLTLSRDTTISATFVLKTYIVTITPPTNGTFTVMNGSTQVNTGATVDSGTALTLTAIPNTGYNFVQWMDGNANATRNLTLTRDTTISATFVPKTYTVTFNSNGGVGTMNSQTFTHGVAQALSANTFTNTQKFFTGWATTPTGDVAYLNQAQYTATDNSTLYAVWADSLYTVTINQPANGEIEVTLLSNGNPVNSGASLVAGTQLSLSAFADYGYEFVQWMDGNTIRLNRTYTVNGNVTISAVIQEIVNPITHTVNIPASATVNGTILVTYETTAKATVTVNDGDQVEEGTELTLTATPNTNYKFEKWWDTETDNPRMLVLTGPISISATFVANDVSITDLSKDVLAVYPNPVTDVLNIQTEQVIQQIVVLDLNGKVVKTLYGNNKTINLQSLPTGNYIVRIHTETAIAPIRIVKQ